MLQITNLFARLLTEITATYVTPTKDPSVTF